MHLSLKKGKNLIVIYKIPIKVVIIIKIFSKIHLILLNLFLNRKIIVLKIVLMIGKIVIKLGDKEMRLYFIIRGLVKLVDFFS